LILKGPTGPFKSKLPAKPSDSGSVTYTISNKEAPDIIPIKVLILPEIENIRPAPVLNKNIRLSLGELAFTVTTPSKSSPGSSKKMFEVGELLDVTIQSIAEILNLEVPKVINIQHNTNKLDLKSMGLTDAEILVIQKESDTKFEELRDSANSTMRSIDNIKISIKETQKNINELNKAIKSLYIVYPDGNATITKLEENLSEQLNTQSTLHFNLDETTKQMNIIYKDIIRLSEVIR